MAFSDSDDAAGEVGSSRKRGTKRRSFREALKFLGGQGSCSGDEENDDGNVMSHGASKEKKKQKREKAAKSGGAAALKAKLTEADKHNTHNGKEKKSKRPKKDDLDALEEEFFKEDLPEAAEGKRTRRKVARPDVEDVIGGEGEGRRGRGKGAGKGEKKKKKDELESELDADEDELKNWTDEMMSRTDASSANLRTAFSMKECPAIVIRRLGATAFLGGKRLEEGGRLLYDEESKTNLHFLLGTYGQMVKARRSEEPADQSVEKQPRPKESNEVRYLKWLLRQAVTLRVVSKGEIRRGKVSMKRLAAAKKFGSYSFEFEANLVDHLDNEDGVVPEGPVRADAKFPELRREVVQEVAGPAAKERVKQQASSRQASISVATSHNLDMEKVRDILMAPSMSFDWDQNDASDEEGLQIDVPLANRHNILRDQLKRSMSASQAKGLTRTFSGLSRGKSFQELPESDSKPSDTVAEGDAPVNASWAPEPSPLQRRLADRQHDSDSVAEVGNDHAEQQQDTAAIIAGSIKVSLTAAVDEAATAKEPALQTSTSSSSSALAVAAAALVPEQVQARAAASSSASAASLERVVAPVCTVVPEAPLVKPVEGKPMASTQASIAQASPDLTQSSMDLTQPLARPTLSAKDMPATQDLPSPRTMWGSSGGGIASLKEDSCDVWPAHEQTAALEGEISPTIPFVPVAAHRAAAEDPISPTLPFVPLVAPATMASRAEAEISQISPTLAFVPVVAVAVERIAVHSHGAAAAAEDDAISPTLPFVPVVLRGTASGNVCVSAEGLLISAKEKGPDLGEEVLKTPGKIKRKATELPEDSPSEAEDDLTTPPPVHSEAGTAEGVEVPAVKEMLDRDIVGAIAKKQQIEWLKQNRIRLQQEEKRRRIQENQLAREQRRMAAARNLSNASMSVEDMSRYESVVAGSAPAVKPNKIAGLVGKVGEEEDDAALFNGFRRAGTRRPNILIGGAAKAS